jgi:hypothetical protein
MALVKYKKWWRTVPDEGSEYVPPAGMAFRLMERGFIEPIRDETGQEVGRYRLTDRGMRKVRE